MNRTFRLHSILVHRRHSTKLSQLTPSLYYMQVSPETGARLAVHTTSCRYSFCEHIGVLLYFTVSVYMDISLYMHHQFSGADTLTAYRGQQWYLAIVITFLLSFCTFFILRHDDPTCGNRVLYSALVYVWFLLFPLMYVVI